MSVTYLDLLNHHLDLLYQHLGLGIGALAWERITGWVA